MEVIKCYLFNSDVLASDTDDEKRLGKSRRQARLNKKESKKRGYHGRKDMKVKYLYQETLSNV